MSTEDLRSLQAPIKESYRADADAAKITLRARATPESSSMACSVDLGRAVYAAQAHAGVGGAGTAACSGDLLLGALAACAQITCQMVAAATGVELESIGVEVEGDLDLRGTLGVSKDVPVGFESIRVKFDVKAPAADERSLARLKRLTEQYCVVFQTLTAPPAIDTSWR